MEATSSGNRDRADKLNWTKTTQPFQEAKPSTSDVEWSGSMLRGVRDAVMLFETFSTGAWPLRVEVSRLAVGLNVIAGMALVLRTKSQMLHKSEV